MGRIARDLAKLRAILHHLTPEGEAMLADRMLAASFAPLDKTERRQLHGLLAKLLGDEPPRG